MSCSLIIRFIVFLYCSIGVTKSAIGQVYKENTPLHKFFQQNFDSTIIYYSWSNWNSYPNYLIISKKENSIYFFTYKSPFSSVLGNFYPADLHIKFGKEESKFRSAIPDTNIYFWPKYFDHRVKTSHWALANSFNIWNLEDEKYEPGGFNIDDAGSDTYYLITKSAVKVLNYYATDFFETCKPKNLDRQNIINTREVIKKIFAN